MKYTAGEIEVTWMDGGLKPDRKMAKMPPGAGSAGYSGSLFIGEEGTMVLAHVGGPHVSAGEV